MWLTFGGMWRWRRVAVARVFALVVRCGDMMLFCYSRVGKTDRRCLRAAMPDQTCARDVGTMLRSAGFDSLETRQHQCRSRENRSRETRHGLSWASPESWPKSAEHQLHYRVQFAAPPNGQAIAMVAVQRDFLARLLRCFVGTLERCCTCCRTYASVRTWPQGGGRILTSRRLGHAIRFLEEMKVRPQMLSLAGLVLVMAAATGAVLVQIRD